VAAGLRLDGQPRALARAAKQRAGVLTTFANDLSGTLTTMSSDAIKSLTSRLSSFLE
jgi:hypothetical protein